MAVHDELQGRRGNIWWVTAAPLAWSVHFLLSYITAAIYCAKYANEKSSVAPIALPIIVYTAVAMVVIAAVAVAGFRRHQLGQAKTPHDAPTREDQVRMIGWASFLLSLLSAVATLFTALVFLLAGSCH